MGIVNRIAIKAISAVLILVSLSTKAAAIEIEVEPEIITFADKVIIRTSGSFDNRCLQIVKHSLGLYEGLLTIVNEVRYFGNDCSDTVIAWEFADTLGPLPPGEYTINLFEHVHTLTGARGDVRTAKFEVYDCDGLPDMTGDGQWDISDLSGLADMLNSNGPPPLCPANADVDCSGQIDQGDFDYLFSYMFDGGPPPCKTWSGA